MTKVFGAGSPEWNEGRASQIAAVRHRGARAGPDRLRRDRDPLRRRRGGICTGNTNARPDPLPDEPGGYTGFKGLFGAKYVNPAINGGSRVGQRHERRARSSTRSASRGFPGFDGMYAKNTLGKVAQMQEHGVPVTFAYISDAHDFHGVSGNTHAAYGPGEAGYVQQLKDYDKAFGEFFTRLEERRDHQGQHALRVHRRGGRPLRGHRTRRPVRRRHDAVHLRERPRDRGQRRPQAHRRDLQREPRHHRATTNFSVHSRHGPERLHQRQPGA